MSNGDYAGGYSSAGNTGTTFGSKQGWGTSGQLQTGNRTKTVTLQADFSKAGDAGTYTVEFGLTPNAASNMPIFAEALITWSVEGNSVTRRVNIGDGVSVSGVGQAARIIMSDTTPDYLTPNGVLYGVSCQVSKGVRGGSKQGPLLLPQGPIGGIVPPFAPNTGSIASFPVAPGPGAVIIVPQNAGVIAVKIIGIDSSTDTLGAGSLVATQRYVEGIVTINTAQYDVFDQPDWVPVVPGTSQILLNNFSGHPVISTSVVFMIDG